MEMTLIEWAGSLFGIAGALMLALNNRYSGWGFILFLISNVFWVVYGIENGIVSLLVMQAFFTATSLLGIKRWFTQEQKPLSIFQKLTF